MQVSWEKIILDDPIGREVLALKHFEQLSTSTARGTEPARRETLPRQLGEFRILREVGRGGMGIVYEAEQVSLGRHVALKVLPRTLLVDATPKRRFEREAKAAAKLHHTNIVTVFGVGEHEGLPYYVMQCRTAGRHCRLWDIATGKARGEPLPHPAGIADITFSPDGQILVRFWSAATARPIGRPLSHLRPVNSVLFARDGTTLITGGDDRAIRFWQVPTPLAGEVESIKAWAEWSSGMMLSPEGASSERDASAWDSRRERLANGKRQPTAAANPFAYAADPGFSHHLRQGLRCLESEDWPAALWHLNREIDAQPQRNGRIFNPSPK